MLPAAAVAAAAAIVTAGCASAGASGPGSPDGAAPIAPANAVAFVAASTDLGSSEWHGLGTPCMNEFKNLAPALGGELDVAVLPSRRSFGSTSRRTPRGSPPSRRRTTCRPARSTAGPRSQRRARTLDTVANATSHLADNARFTEAMGRLPSGALVRAYANGHEAQTLLASIPRLQTAGTTDVRWGRGCTHEHKQRLEARGVRTHRGGTATPPYTSTLGATRFRPVHSPSSISRFRAACSRTWRRFLRRS